MAASSVAATEAVTRAWRAHALELFGRERMPSVGTPARSLRALPARLVEAWADGAASSTGVARRHRRPALPKSVFAARARRSIALINRLLLLLRRHRLDILPSRLHKTRSRLNLRRVLHPTEIGTSDHLAFLSPVQEERRAFTLGLKNNRM